MPERKRTSKETEYKCQKRPNTSVKRDLHTLCRVKCRREKRTSNGVRFGNFTAMSALDACHTFSKVKLSLCTKLNHYDTVSALN